MGCLLDVREGIVISVLRVDFEDGGGIGFVVGEGGDGVGGEGFEVGLEVGGKGGEGFEVGTEGLDVGTGGFEVGIGGFEVGTGGFDVGTGGFEVGGRVGGEGFEVGFEVGVGGSVGFDVGGVGGEGFEVGTGGFEVGMGDLEVVTGGFEVEAVVGTSDGVGDPVDLEDDMVEGIGTGIDIGGIDVAVGSGGKTVVLEKGGEGLNVGILRVGKLNVGIGNFDEENDVVEFIEGTGIGGIDIVVFAPGGKGFDEDNVGIGDVVEAFVVLKMGGEGVTVGTLKVGILSDEGFDVGNGGTSVVLTKVGEGARVGRLRLGEVYVGKPPVELNTGGSNDGFELGSDNVGICGRDVTGNVIEGSAVVLDIDAVGSAVGILRLEGESVGSTRETEGRSVVEILTLGTGSVKEGGKAVGIDKDGGNIVVDPGIVLEFADTDERDTPGDEGSERVGSIIEGLPEVTPKLSDADAEGELTSVDGRGIPDGRLHVKFCAIAVLESPNRANAILKNIMPFIQAF